MRRLIPFIHDWSVAIARSTALQAILKSPEVCTIPRANKIFVNESSSVGVEMVATLIKTPLLHTMQMKDPLDKMKDPLLYVIVKISIFSSHSPTRSTTSLQLQDLAPPYSAPQAVPTE